MAQIELAEMYASTQQPAEAKPSTSRCRRKILPASGQFATQKLRAA